MKRRWPGWPSVAAVVMAYDGWAIVADQPTLSSQFKGWAATHPVTATCVTTYFIAHLWGACPPRVDPFNLFAGAMRAAYWAVSSPAQQSETGPDLSIIPDVAPL